MQSHGPAESFTLNVTAGSPDGEHINARCSGSHQNRKLKKERYWVDIKSSQNGIKLLIWIDHPHSIDHLHLTASEPICTSTPLPNNIQLLYIQRAHPRQRRLVRCQRSLWCFSHHRPWRSSRPWLHAYRTANNMGEEEKYPDLTHVRVHIDLFPTERESLWENDHQTTPDPQLATPEGTISPSGAHKVRIWAHAWLQSSSKCSTISWTYRARGRSSITARLGATTLGRCAHWSGIDIARTHSRCLRVQLCLRAHCDLWSCRMTTTRSMPHAPILARPRSRKALLAFDANCLPLLFLGSRWWWWIHEDENACGEVQELLARAMVGAAWGSPLADVDTKLCGRTQSMELVQLRLRRSKVRWISSQFSCGSARPGTP